MKLYGNGHSFSETFLPCSFFSGRVGLGRLGRSRRGPHGGFRTAATPHATHTTQKDAVKRFLKRLRSHTNSKLDPRNDTRKVKKLGPRPYELTSHAHTRCLHPSARHRMLSTVSDATEQEGNDYVQGCSGTRGNSRARPCGTRARQQLALAHVCKGGASYPRRS